MVTTRREFLQSVAATGAGLVLGSCRTTSSSQTAISSNAATLILKSGKVTTLDRKQPTASAIAIRDGRILAVGSDNEVMRCANDATRIIELHGRRVIPGLNDSHIHVIRGGLSYNMELRWDGVPSLADAMEMLRDQASRTPQGQWVRVVGGFAELQFAERRLPTLAELNAAAPETPVFILHLYDRALLNRAALRAVGYTKDTPEPAGGIIERDRDGNPTGLLIANPNAAILYKTLALGPKLPPEQQMNSTRHFMRELNRLGITSCCDAGGGFQNYPEDYTVVNELHRRGELTLRVAYNLFTQRPQQEREDFATWAASNRMYQGDEFLRLNGAGEMLVYSAADFEDFRVARPGMASSMEADLEAVVGLLARNKWAFRLHATYDETISRALDAFERVDREVPISNLRWFFDHCETISDRNIERVKALGGGIAVQHRMAYQGEYFIERYGSKAAARTPPVRRILEMGVPLGAGTDATRVASYNPWVCLGWLVTGKTVGGSQLYSDDNVLNREEALRLYTLGSAWFSREEERKGMLAPGLFADVAVLSADYFTVPQFKISRIESVLTIMDGKVVYGKDEFTKHAPPLPPPSPVWSPLLRFGGYGAPRYAGGTVEFVPLHAREGSCGCRAPALSDACHLWGASGCDCFAF